MNQIEEAFIYSTLERLALSFEKMAQALAGLNETAQRTYERKFPEPKSPKDPVISRVLSEEDRIAEEQGRTDHRPIKDWLSSIVSGEDEEEDIGVREREFLERKAKERNAGSQESESVQGSVTGGSQAVGGEAGATVEDSPVERDDKAGRQRVRRAKGRASGSAVLPG